MDKKPRISIVVAVTKKDAAIGNGGKLLFRISDDMKRFKRLTKGHPVIMGRKTFESIGHPLPERANIVITRNPKFKADGVITASSIENAIEKASLSLSPLIKGVAESARPGVVDTSPAEDGNAPRVSGDTTLHAEDGGAPFAKGDSPTSDEIFLIGGGEIYRQALPYTDKLYLTIVESGAKGDVFFPDWRKDFTREVFREERVDPKTGLKYTWVDLEREKEV